MCRSERDKARKQTVGESQRVVESLPVVSDCVFCGTFFWYEEGSDAFIFYFCAYFRSNHQKSTPSCYVPGTCVELAYCRRASAASTAQRSATSPAQGSKARVRTYVPIRARQRKQADRVGESHVMSSIHIYISLCSQNEGHRNLPGPVSYTHLTLPTTPYV